MKATEAALQRTLKKLNSDAKEIGLTEFDLSVHTKVVGNQHRNQYALKTIKGSYATGYVPGKTLLYYMSGILLGVTLQKNGGSRES